MSGFPPPPSGPPPFRLRPPDPFAHESGTCRTCDEDRRAFKSLNDRRPGVMMGTPRPLAKPMSIAVARLIVTVLVLIITVSFLMVAWSLIVGAEV